MKIGFYAGSFDPFTNGHLHVVQKSLQLFDHLIIGIGTHPEKTRKFDKEAMKQAMEKVMARENLNATVITYSGLSVDAAKAHHATFLVRGIRNGMDYAEEENLALINEELSKIDTIYIRSGKLGIISSSMVMSLLENKRDITNYVPKEILDLIHEKNKDYE